MQHILGLVLHLVVFLTGTVLIKGRHGWLLEAASAPIEQHVELCVCLTEFVHERLPKSYTVVPVHGFLVVVVVPTL